MQPGIPNQPQYYPTAPYGATGQTNSGSNMNKGILGALGGGTAAGLLSGAALMGVLFTFLYICFRCRFTCCVSCDTLMIFFNYYFSL